VRTRRIIAIPATGATALLTLVLAGPAQADEAVAGHQYSSVDLGTLDGGPNSYPNAINDLGDVVGSSQLRASRYSHAFWWHDGKMSDLGVLSDSFPVSYAYDINNRGQIVGSSAAEGGGFHAVLWSDGQMIDLGTLGGGSSNATAVNDFGQIVGDSETDTGEWHAFRWQKGVMTDLGPEVDPAIRPSTNLRGQVAGGSSVDGELHAFRWQSRGGRLDLGSPGGFSYATAMDDWGRVVGFTRIESGWGHAFLWCNGTMTDLGILSGGPGYSSATGINDLGQIVGNSDSRPTGGESHPFLWQYGVLTDLTTRGVSADTFLYGINLRGQLIGSRVGPNGDRQAVLYV
jgi:probable HAF family extracellular repeat protein